MVEKNSSMFLNLNNTRICYNVDLYLFPGREGLSFHLCFFFLSGTLISLNISSFPSLDHNYKGIK